MKTSNVLISIAFLAMTSTAFAGLGTNGLGTNGLGTNGLGTNGVGLRDASATRPTIVVSGVRGGATATDHQVHLTGIRLKQH